MSSISISTPFHKKFVHTDHTVGTAATILLPAVNPGERRIATIIQNKSSTATLTLIFSDTGTVGFSLQPSTLFSIDNYNGTIMVASSAPNTVVHIAYSLV